MSNDAILAILQSRGSFSFGSFSGDRIAARAFRDWARDQGVTVKLLWGANMGGCVATLDAPAPSDGGIRVSR